MNKKTTSIIIAIVVLLVLAGGAFFMMHHTKMNASDDGQAANTQAQAQQMTTGKKSLSDFFSMTGTLKCTYSDKTNNSSGTMYVSNGKMRGDFQSQDNGASTVAHMVNDGSYIYYWSDGQKNGYKMSLASVKSEASQVSMAPGASSSSNAQPQGMNMKQQADYSCGPWVASASVFSVPSDITFVDYTSMMQGATSHSSTAPQGGSVSSQKVNPAVCSQCDKAPAGSARNQCLSALHCN